MHGKTQRPIKFTSWKQRESAWEVIEHRALELGYASLHRKIQGKDLHAAEAQCHPYCRDNFHTEYRNYLRSKKWKEHPLQTTKQACKAAAHSEAFNLVFETIKEVIKKMKSCNSHLYSSCILIS